MGSTHDLKGKSGVRRIEKVDGSWFVVDHGSPRKLKKKRLKRAGAPVK